MSAMSNVTVTITQGGTTIATLTTDSNGNASTVLNAGTYNVAFSAAGRNTINVSITLSYNNTFCLFVFPVITNAGTGCVASLMYDNDVADSGSGFVQTHSVTTSVVFTNS